MTARSFLFLLILGAVATLPAHANTFTITPTFNSSITSDPNAAAIEGAINLAIGNYENLFSNPINVPIEFVETQSGLGGSTKFLYSAPYSTFYSAYSTNAANNNNPAAQTALALGVVPSSNPVTSSANLAMTTADINALGINCSGCTGPGGFDGIIGLNTQLTTPGSPGSSLSYLLISTVEHEINEVLGLGSSLGQTYQTSNPSVEDLFRYASNGSRSYTTNPSANAYFSINGSTDLAQFDNQNDGGDWADWQSNPLPAGVQPQVQDAFGTPGADPSLGVEITALEAIGYDLASPAPTPEPGTMTLMGSGLLFLAVAFRRKLASARLS
jgi:PEP-CTERM motif